MGLFSTHYHTEKTINKPYVKEVNITEKRAPTDESIKIYDEMYKKAQKNVLGAFKVQTNLLDAVVIMNEDERTLMMKDNPAITYKAIFNINGKEKVVDFKIDPEQVFQLKRKPQEQADSELIEMVFNKLGAVLAAEMIKSVKTTNLGLSKDYNI